MRIADHMIHCAFAIGIQNECGGFVPYGTAFVVTVVQGGLVFPHLVTAKHVVDMIPGDKIFFRANSEDGRVLIQWSLKSLGVNHPLHDDARNYIDVYVSIINHFGVKLTHIVPDDFITSEIMHVENIGVGEEVATVGMFYSVLGTRKNTPIVRIGNIAALPEEPVPSRFGNIDAYLVETRSIYGLSGSPVFINMDMRPPVERRGPLQLTRRSHYFLGIMHGYYGVNDMSETASGSLGSGDEILNAGIAIVVPADKVRETLDHPDLIKHRTDHLTVFAYMQDQGDADVPDEVR
jgi:hypothetical protein